MLLYRALWLFVQQKTAKTFAKNEISTKASFWGIWRNGTKREHWIFFANAEKSKKVCDICEKWVFLHTIKWGFWERFFRKSLFSKKVGLPFANFSKLAFDWDSARYIFGDCTFPAFDIKKSWHLRTFWEIESKWLNSNRIENSHGRTVFQITDK